ncbi:helix-turn-helix domain-containing protein [Acetobacter okinawensis]|uniref:helix-turn-helix domain-containing protein n=1 Tax=Acetobacter okinawensis TaxID=1076594 RepID=UPI0039E9EA0A
MAEYAQGSEQDQGSSLPPLPDVEGLGVGEALRKRREQLGWSIGDVAAWLRIRGVYLEALENGNASVLPAEVYALGFLRTYGQALGFDPEHLLKLYRQEGRLGVRKPELDFPDPPPDRRLPPAVSISLGLAVILASYIGWYCFVGHVPPAPERVPPVASLMPGESAKNAPSPQVASILPDHNVAQVPPVPVVAQVVPPQNASPVQNEAQSTPAPSPTAPVEEAVVPQSVNPVASVPEQPAAEPAEHNAPDVASGTQDAPLTLKALAASWVQVRNAGGKVVYDHILQPGDAWTVPADNGPYTLTVGNAGGIALAQGSITTPPLGKNGAVLRHIALTPDAVRQVQAGGSFNSVATPAVPVVAPPAVGGAALPVQSVTADKPKADVSAVPVVGAGEGSAGAPLASAAKPPLRRAAPPAEPSADDLNARQLNGLGAH